LNYIETGNQNSATKNINYRITHLNDAVPQLPPPKAQDTFHQSPKYWINATTNVAVTSASKVLKCNSIAIEKAYCNAAQTRTDDAAHGWYFNNISACHFTALIWPIEVFA
jgi:hypothetical protein